MAITFRKLEVFVAAAEDCNFRRTADRLRISQPSVSTQVRSIEDELGQQLFDRRRGRHPLLSREGRAFLARARSLLQAQANLQAAITAPRLRRQARVRVAVGPMLLEQRVKPLLPEFLERNPDLRVEFVPFDPVRDGDSKLRSASVDIAIYTGPAPPRPTGVVELVTQVPHTIYGSPALVARIAAGAAVDSLPFVMPPDTHMIARWQQEELARCGLRPRSHKVRPSFIDVLCDMVVDGKGLGLIADEQARPFVARGQLVPLASPQVAPAWRVMVLGPRAQAPEMAPALAFFRAIGRADSPESVRYGR